MIKHRRQNQSTLRVKNMEYEKQNSEMLKFVIFLSLWSFVTKTNIPWVSISLTFSFCQHITSFPTQLKLNLFSSPAAGADPSF